MKNLNIKQRIVILTVIFISISIYAVNKKYSKHPDLQHNQTPQERILGVWILENHPNEKIEFLSNGEMKKYENNLLVYTDTYSISNLCGGFSGSNGLLYLKQIDSQDADEYCFVIANGVYIDNSDTLTLITDGQGKVIVYERP